MYSRKWASSLGVGRVIQSDIQTRGECYITMQDSER